MFQTSQTSTDQTLPDPPQIMNATKTPDTEDKETLPNSPILLNDILSPDTKIKQLLFQILFKNHSLC